MKLADINALVESVIDRIERAAVLDGPADKAAGLVTKVLKPGPVKNLLSGTGSGHAAHPIIVLLPLGSWASALYLDALDGLGKGSDGKAARRLLALGNLSAVPTVLTGLSDWADTQGAERRVGLVHASLNLTGIAFFVGSSIARAAGARKLGTLSGLLGMGAVSAGGWLGGHLAYARGVGTDTTAFEVPPEGWTDVAAVDDVTNRPLAVDVGGVAVLLVRDGQVIRALSDRCTHRGGPLHEGVVEDGCVVCPWHESSFRLSDGQVARGPATRPQRTFDVETVDGRVRVRASDDPGSLRSEPVTGAAAGSVSA